MSVAAVIDGDYDVEFIDGTWSMIRLNRSSSGAGHSAKLLAATVMPGPQLTQALPVL